MATLGGLMIIGLAIEPKVRGFKPGRERWILRMIEFHSKSFFEGEVNPAVPCRKILWHVKFPYSMKEILVGKIHG
jgi:hypothetical protein